MRPYRRARSQPSREVDPDRCGVCRAGRVTRSSASSRVGRPRPTVLWTGTGPVIAAGLVHRSSSPSRRSRPTGRRPRAATTSPTRSRPVSGSTCSAPRMRGWTCSVSAVRRSASQPAPAPHGPADLAIDGDVRVPLRAARARIMVAHRETPGSRRIQADFAVLPGVQRLRWRQVGCCAYSALRVQGRRHRVTGMSVRLRMRQALPEAMRARDKAAVSALRATLAALDNAEAVPVDEAELGDSALEHSPVGAGATERARRELSERGVVDVVRAEAAERVEIAAQLTAPAHADRAARLRAEAAVLLRFLDGPGTAGETASHRTPSDAGAGPGTSTATA